MGIRTFKGHTARFGWQNGTELLIFSISFKTDTTSASQRGAQSEDGENTAIQVEHMLIGEEIDAQKWVKL